MVYSFEQAKAGLSHPGGVRREYGVFGELVSEPKFFSLRKVIFQEGWEGNFNFGGTIGYVETGKLKINGNDFPRGSVIKPSSKYGFQHNLKILEKSHVYFFGGPKDYRKEIHSELTIEGTFDRILDRPWGSIETIVSNEKFAGKRIFMRAGKQSSLEFHKEKKEAYFLHSGKLKVGVRVEKAKNKSIILNPADVLSIPECMMHMRICLEDCVIFEISTKDDDVHTHFPQDGEKYEHIED